MEDAEASVNEISKLKGGEEKIINHLSFHLIWKGKGGITTGKIPPNTYEYFDFGNIMKPNPDQLIELIFTAGGEIKLLKSNGSYKIRIEFSANNIDHLIKTYILELKDKWADNPDNIKEMVLIKEC